MSSLFAKYRWLPLTLILLLAIGLRLINLGGRALWYDEAFAVLLDLARQRPAEQPRIVDDEHPDRSRVRIIDGLRASPVGGPLISDSAATPRGPLRSASQP